MWSKSNITKNLVTLFAVISITALTALNLYGQPNWVPGTPIIPSTGPLSIDVDYGIDEVGTVYIIILNYNSGMVSSNTVKNGALLGPSGSRVATAVLNIAVGDVGNILNVILDVTQPNRTHTVFVVAEDGFSVLQAAPIRLLTSTTSCPDILPATSMAAAQRCVNGSGSTQTYQFFTSTGILKGADWIIDWGNGSPDYTFTSTTDGERPAPNPSYTYTSHDSCYYDITLTITNAGGCAAVGALEEGQTIKLHGRDVATDGNGEMLLVNNANSSPDTIKVCEGNEAFITLRDDGTWDCDENFHSYPPGEMNSPDRNIQFVYGMHPQTQAVENTITGNVDITGAYPGTANGTSGHASGVINIDTDAMSPITNPNKLV